MRCELRVLAGLVLVSLLNLPDNAVADPGPVADLVNGDHAQLAWGNRNVTQSQYEAQTIAPGYEKIAAAIAETLKSLGSADLPVEDQIVAEEVARDALAEVVKEEPDPGLVRRSVRTLFGYLTPVAYGMQTGAAEGAQEWANTAIEQLGSAAF